jgi:arylsulfatase A
MEGGMREPCIARWPGHIPPGTEFDQITSTIDVLPTLAELAGAKAPSPDHIDGRSIADILLGKSDQLSHEAYYYYYRDQLQAVRSGPWKLHLAGTVKRRNRPVREVPAKLYNLDEDIAESNDVADANPEIVKQLLAYAEEARQKYGDGKRQGELQRPAGLVEEAVPLVKE